MPIGCWRPQLLFTYMKLLYPSWFQFFPTVRTKCNMPLIFQSFWPNIFQCLSPAVTVINWLHYKYTSSNWVNIIFSQYEYLGNYIIWRLQKFYSRCHFPSQLPIVNTLILHHFGTALQEVLHRNFHICFLLCNSAVLYYVL